MTEQTYIQIDLAKEQLEVALSLFLDNACYGAVITLAGAAEEIFGKTLKRYGKEAVLDWKFKNIIFYGVHLKQKEFVDEENKIRNTLKHLVEDNEFITADLEDSACWMLVRAIENASRLDISIARSHEFNDWFYSNIIGI